MTFPKYALNHQEVDNRFPRKSDKERRLNKLKGMIKNDIQRINKLEMKLASDKLEIQILKDLVENPSKFQIEPIAIKSLA